VKIKTWDIMMGDKEASDLAYWERNMLALTVADGWYSDYLFDANGSSWPRYHGFHRVLSLADGRITFHIPDDFDVGDLPQIACNWDGHTTQEKWERVAKACGVEVES